MTPTYSDGEGLKVFFDRRTLLILIQAVIAKVLKKQKQWLWINSQRCSKAIVSVGFQVSDTSQKIET